MKIISITPMKVHSVLVGDNDYHHYTRYSAGLWTVTMGESDEPVYDCSEIEEEFQRFIKHPKEKQ